MPNRQTPSRRSSDSPVGKTVAKSVRFSTALPVFTYQPSDARSPFRRVAHPTPPPLRVELRAPTDPSAPTLEVRKTTHSCPFYRFKMVDLVLVLLVPSSVKTCKNPCQVVEKKNQRLFNPCWATTSALASVHVRLVRRVNPACATATAVGRDAAPRRPGFRRRRGTLSVRCGRSR